MQALAEQFLSEEEYQAFEDASPTKHEFFGGRIYAMSGGSRRHAVIGANALVGLAVQLQGTQCLAVGSDQRVKVEATGLHTYPDVVAYCSTSRFDARHEGTLLDAVVIIEVLSPSTANYDRTDKFDHYKRIETLRDYILIAQDRVRVEHFQRLDANDWRLHIADSVEQSLTLDSIGCTLALASLYAGIELPPTLPLRPQATEE